MSKKNPGKVIVIVAPSGAGKTTIARRLLKEYPRIKFSVSATTRPPREGETNGKAYYFKNNEEFARLTDENLFLEWEFYSGHKYGTLRSEVDKLVESGYFPLLDIEVKGALNVKEIYDSDCVAIFIQPPSIEALRQRLLKRGTESAADLKQRIQRAEEEMAYADHFDYLVVNDDLEVAYKEVKEIIEPFITD